MNQAAADHTAPVTIAGTNLRCQNCDHDRFFKRKGPLNTRFPT